MYKIRYLRTDYRTFSVPIFKERLPSAFPGQEKRCALERRDWASSAFWARPAALLQCTACVGRACQHVFSGSGFTSAGGRISSQDSVFGCLKIRVRKSLRIQINAQNQNQTVVQLLNKKPLRSIVDYPQVETRSTRVRIHSKL